MQQAVDRAWPEALGMLEPVPGQEELDVDIIPVTLAEQLLEWRQGVIAVLESVGLRLPAAKSVQGMGGRIGRHSDDLGTLLDEMTSVWRSDPQAKW